MNKAFAELKKKPAGDLQKELADSKLELVKLDAKLATGSAAKEAGKRRNLRKKIARVKTALAAGGTRKR